MFRKYPKVRRYTMSRIQEATTRRGAADTGDRQAPRARPGAPPYWRRAQHCPHLLFAHWPVPPEHLQPFIPPPLELDCVDGQAWLGVVAFRLSGIHLRRLPEVPGVRMFPEVNLRTYV